MSSPPGHQAAGAAAPASDGAGQRSAGADVLLKVTNLEVRYGDLIGVADVSFEVPVGGVVALLGSNGAGKTTTLNAVAGLVPASNGTVLFEGQSVNGLPAHAIVRRGLALSPEGWRLFVQQSVESNLLLGATPVADKRKIPHLLERVYATFPRLAERRLQRAGTMSGGERQMLAVGRALMSEPRLLLLDEPSLGLAPAVIETPILEQVSEEHIRYMTSRIPMGRVGKPDEVAALVAFLCSRDLTFSTGAVYDISGGRATY